MVSPVSRPDAGPEAGGAEAPDVTSFGRLYAPTAPYHRALRELHATLTAIRADGTILGRGEQLARLSRWVRSGGKLPPIEGQPKLEEPAPRARLRFLVRVLREHPSWRHALARTIAGLLADTESVHLFAEVGVPNTRGLWAETSDRLARRFLPQPRDDDDFAHVLADLFPSRADPGWLNDLGEELLDDTIAVLCDSQHRWDPLRRGILDAVRLLATRISSLGLTEELRARSHKTALADSPFFKMPRLCDAWVAAAQAGEGADAEAQAIGEGMALCRVELDTVLQSLETSGVSVDVVYRLEVIEKCLERVTLLLPLARPSSEAGRSKQIRDALVVLVRAGLADHSVRELFQNNMRLLGRKIVERAGVTGEHYITSGRKEYWKMLRSAAGGGILTVATAAFKLAVSAAKFAPFVEGALAGLNYALSFLVMQLCHFTLATKQPSMTAAALAHSVHLTHDAAGTTKPDLTDLVSMISRITRSQLAAALGNITFVSIGALAFDLVYVELTGHHFLDPAKAQYLLASMHPTQSATIWYAILTGVILWMASIVAGWVENWAVYRRLPEAIAQHRAGRWLGRKRMERLSRFFAHNISGFGGNVSLGFMLGMTPVLGRFFGLPLDVRHVTLSTGTVALAACALGPDVLVSGPFLAALGGIGCMFVFNLSVSFLLALTVALRAKGVGWRARVSLLRAVVVRFFRRPAEFFFPPKDDPKATPSSSSH